MEIINFTVLRALTFESIIIRIFAAFLLGGIIGLEREIKNRPAGLRTHTLVCMGACLVMLTNQYIYQVFGTSDPARMGAQVVSGIGFLGAGTIIVTKQDKIKGLTSAAGLWTSATVGLALGIGFYEAAIIATFFVFITLTILQLWDDKIHGAQDMQHVYIELTTDMSFRGFLCRLRETQAEMGHVRLEHNTTVDHEFRAITLAFRAKNKNTYEDVIAHIEAIDGVIYVDKR